MKNLGLIDDIYRDLQIMRTPRSRGRAVILKVTELHQDSVSELGTLW